MIITPIKTRLIKPQDDLLEVITEVVPKIEERSIITIASKAFSFAENRFVPKKDPTDKNEKWNLAKQESEYFLDPNESKYQCMFTIKGNWMFVNAGVDESNSENQFTVWPKDPQTSLNQLWHRLREHYGLKELGLIMTDSHSMPLNWGVVGHGIAYCGFKPLKNYVGTPDLHGRHLEMEQLSLLQSLAAAGSMEMGEGNEQQPLAIISDIKQTIIYEDNPPTQDKLNSLKVTLEDDLYAPFITRVPWQKGGSK